MTPEDVKLREAALAATENLDRAITTAANDDLTEPMSEKRRRHTDRIAAMSEASEVIAKLLDEVERLRAALERIQRWEMPETGQYWPDGDPMSYGACYGSNGERDVIREIARAALQPSGAGK